MVDPTPTTPQIRASLPPRSRNLFNRLISVGLANLVGLTVASSDQNLGDFIWIYGDGQYEPFAVSP